MRVVAIEEAGIEDVFNMEVETTHDFAVNNGVIVHNCYDEQRYAFMEMPIAPRANFKQRIILDDPLNMHHPNKPRYSYIYL